MALRVVVLACTCATPVSCTPSLKKGITHAFCNFGYCVIDGYPGRGQ